MTAILIGGEKGGTGKSTIATNLAIMATMMDKDVLLLDTDKQASSAKFISKRNERGLKPTPSCVQIRGKYLHKEIEDLYDRYEIIIIDAGGQDSVELRAAMACSKVSRLYTPLQPSEFDLDTLVKMDEMVNLAKSYNSHLEAYLIFNRIPTHKKITLLDSAVELLHELENITLSINISHRVPFQYATSELMSVIEFEIDRIKSMPAWQANKYTPKASEEMSKLYTEVFKEDFKSELFSFPKGI